MNRLTVKSESYLKVFLALWIVIGHLPNTGWISLMTHWAVAGFFFMSGSGLASKSEGTTEENYRMNLFKSAKKLLIPYYICQFVYLVGFCLPMSMTDFGIRLIREILLIDVNLPHAWYVRTQLILYVIWWAVGRLDKKWVRLLLMAVGVAAYIVLFAKTGQLFTSYKTVFAFLAGILYKQCEDKVEKLVTNPFVAIVAACLAFQLAVIGATRFDGDSVWSVIAMNLTGVMICVVYIFILKKVNLGFAPIVWLAPVTYEIYLVQGIAKEIILEVPILGPVLSFALTIILAFVLNRLINVCSKLIKRH